MSYRLNFKLKCFEYFVESVYEFNKDKIVCIKLVSLYIYIKTF